MMPKRRGTAELTQREAELAIRRNAEAQMNPALHAHYEAGRALLTSVNENLLDANRQLGRIVHEVNSDPARYETAGVEKLALAWDYPQQRLYKARAFFESYTDAEFAAFLALRTPAGASLTWSHMIALLSVTDKRRRRLLEQQAASASMTVEELNAAVREQASGVAAPSQRPGSGRKHVAPKSFAQGVKNFENISGDVRRRITSVWLPMVEQVRTTPPEQITVATMGSVTQMQTALETTIRELQRQAEVLAGVRAHVDQVLTTRTGGN